MTEDARHPYIGTATKPDLTLADTDDLILEIARRFETIELKTPVSTYKYRLCAKCRTLFLAIRRQIYCTPKCSQDVRTAAYRGKLGREEVNSRRRRAYQGRSVQA